MTVTNYTTLNKKNILILLLINKINEVKREIPSITDLANTTAFNAKTKG